MIIPFILEKAISLYADKEAVVCGNQRFTYGQFADRTHRLANFMKSMGIGRGDCVAILHYNSHQFLETYFATAQLGAILNPLNFRLSPRELAIILQDSAASLLIFSVRFQDHVNFLVKMGTGIKKFIKTDDGCSPAKFKTIDYEDALAGETHERLPMPNISDEDAAHLYYTSGTTGRPKGVILSHKNVCTHALAAIAELKISDADIWIHVAPLFHLADAWASFAITWVGGKHVVVTDFEPSLILSTIQDEKITITNMVPTTLNLLVNNPGVNKYDFSSLRVIMSGGAPIAPDVVRKIVETFRCNYIQTYGMTETSPYLTVSILKENLTLLSSEKQFEYIAKTGRPFLGVLLKVVREDGTAVNPDGKEVGEIIVKGDSVTQGYWKRSGGKTDVLKDGWFYTGDMAVIDKEGYVNIVDRKKDMIITGGENVYSVEVENILYAHPSVLEAAVIGVPDPKWGEAVKAVVTLKQGHHATEKEIINHCRLKIAHFKAPKSVDFVSELPKTGAGKIYKKGIKEKH